MRATALLVVSMVTTLGCGGQSPTSPSASPTFSPVGDLELVRCSENVCDEFTFLLRNTGDVCALTFDFRGTVTLTKSSGVTSTANWTLENKFDRLFLPGETRRMIQDGGVLQNPAGPHTYAVTVTRALVPSTCD